MNERPVYIQRDHLQKAMQAPFLCRVTPESAPDRVRITVGGTAEWQPIETAPRNASRILIYTPRSGRVQEAWWALEYEGGPGYWQTPVGPMGRGYVILPEAATHWMPLPPPPSTPKQGEGE